MTLNAVQQTLHDPSVTEVKATPGEFKFHCNNPKTGKAQLIRDQQYYLGIGKVEVCDEDRLPLADQQAHVVPGYQPDEAKDEVIVCQDMKNERWYRFTGTLKPFNPKVPPVAAQPQPVAVRVEAPEPAPKVPAPKAKGSRAVKRPVNETFGQELQRIRQSLDAGLDPDVRIDFIAKYLGESRANLYRKMKLTPAQFPNPIKRGHGSFWPFSLVEAYRKGEWKPQPAVSKAASF